MTDKLNRIRLGVICVWSVITMVVYLFVFGDSGYLVRKDLNSKIEEVRYQIRDLRVENERLNEKYHSLIRQKESAPAESILDNSETVILKLKDVEEDATFAEDGNLDIFQARIIFLTLMSFVGVLSVFLAGLLFNKMTSGHGPNGQNSSPIMKNMEN